MSLRALPVGGLSAVDGPGPPWGLSAEELRAPEFVRPLAACTLSTLGGRVELRDLARGAETQI
jgi:hypothetical protein